MNDDDKCNCVYLFFILFFSLLKPLSWSFDFFENKLMSGTSKMKRVLSFISI